MSRAARCYDISALLAQGGNDMGRVKGDQRGNIAARELKPACRLAGIPVIGWHVLRHTAITLIQQAGATGVEAQRFAGHASDAMRERYTHAEVDRLRASVDAVRLVEEQGKGRLM